MSKSDAVCGESQHARKRNGCIFSLSQKTMHRGKDIRVNDELFLFASENEGGQEAVSRVDG
jgi:hypothetical protein